VDAGFARQLERELAEAKAEVVRADYATRRAVERIAELEVDAERYRWIRNNGFCAFDGETDLTWRSAANIDAVIDAVRAKEM